MKKFITIVLLFLPLILFAGWDTFPNGINVVDDTTTSVDKTTWGFYFYTADSTLYYSNGVHLVTFAQNMDSIDELTADHIKVDSLTIYKYLVIYRQDTIAVAVVDTFGYEKFSPRWEGFFNSPVGTGVLEDTTFYDGNTFYSQYQWRSSESTLQGDTLGSRIPLPFYFPGFDTATADSALKITINTSSTNTSNNLVSMILYKESAPTTKLTEASMISSSAKTPRIYDYRADRTVLSTIGNTDVLIIKFVLQSKDSYRAGVCSVELTW